MFRKYIAIKKIIPVTRVRGIALLTNFLNPSLKDLSNSKIKVIEKQSKFLRFNKGWVSQNETKPIMYKEKDLFKQIKIFKSFILKCYNLNIYPE